MAGVKRYFDGLTAQQRWNRRNPEKMQVACRKWRVKNPDYAYSYYLEHQAENRERRTQLQLARRRKMEVIPQKTLESVYDYYGRVCVYCDVPSTGVDHLIPVSKGGTNDFYNLAPCCLNCNSKKYTRPIWVMLRAA